MRKNFSKTPLVHTGSLSLEVCSHMSSVGAALDAVAGLSSQLNPSPQSRLPASAGSSAGIQQGDLVHVLSDRGRTVGTALVVNVGPGTRFHNREVAGCAVICNLSVMDAMVARAQLAWISDGDVVIAGSTPLAEVPRGQMLAVPERCLRFLGRA